jgi:hypothetical protein
MKKIAFTPILNGMPFIKKQAEFIPNNFDHWYIIEGVLNNNNDGCHNGNVVDERFISKNFLSIDGTTEFLDELTSKNKNITVIRIDRPWNGYVEMANSFMNEVENSFLMYIDVDEFWTKKHIDEIYEFACNNTYNTFMFKCYYFFGKDRYVYEDNKFGNNWFEWIRAFVVKDKMKFTSLQPPSLYNEKDIRLFPRYATEQKGWIFTHYAYAIKEQIIFKEVFHKHANLLEHWNNLQQVPKGTDCLLSDYISILPNSNTKIRYI